MGTTTTMIATTTTTMATTTTTTMATMMATRIRTIEPIKTTSVVQSRAQHSTVKLFLVEKKVFEFQFFTRLKLKAHTHLDLARGYPIYEFISLGRHIKQGNLADLVRQFLYFQRNPDDPNAEVSLEHCPELWDAHCIAVFHLARATFCAPSNLSGVGGMYQELIRSTPIWRKGEHVAARRDCVYVEKGGCDTDDGMRSLLIARVLLFFSFEFNGITYPCALVHWFTTFGDAPDPDTGMWIVEPEYDENTDLRSVSVIHLDSIVRAAHLLPIFDGVAPVDRTWLYTMTLDLFRGFYVNKYIDHHAFELAY